jgi:hypothetical protein
MSRGNKRTNSPPKRQLYGWHWPSPGSRRGGNDANARAIKFHFPCQCPCPCPPHPSTFDWHVHLEGVELVPTVLGQIPAAYCRSAVESARPNRSVRAARAASPLATPVWMMAVPLTAHKPATEAVVDVHVMATATRVRLLLERLFWRG